MKRFAMVECPECGAPKSSVTLVRQLPEQGKTVRRRRCTACDYRWYTLQDAERPISQYGLRWVPAQHCKSTCELVEVAA